MKKSRLRDGRVEPFLCQHVGGTVEGWGVNIDSNELSVKVFRSGPGRPEIVARREQEDSVSTGRIKKPCLWIAADRPAGQVIGNCGWSEERLRAARGRRSQTHWSADRRAPACVARARSGPAIALIGPANP